MFFGENFNPVAGSKRLAEKEGWATVKGREMRLLSQYSQSYLHIVKKTYNTH